MTRLGSLLERPCGFGFLFVLLAVAGSAAGQTPAGGEFLVNTYTTGDQQFAHAFMDRDANFVVTWADLGQLQLSGQRYWSSGARRGGEFAISSPAGVRADDAAGGRNGEFVAVWKAYPVGQPTSIRGQRYDAAGNRAGAEFFVNLLPANDLNNPRVGAASDGRFVVCWIANNRVVARRFDSSAVPSGGEFRVNSAPRPSLGRADIAVGENGGFVVVWNAVDGDIFAHRYDASGNPLGEEFRVNSYVTGYQTRPSVDMARDGAFVVTWFGAPPTVSLGARRFSPDGKPIGNDFVVNTSTGSQGSFSDIVHDARGNFVVAWQGSEVYLQEADIRAQRFDAGGSRRGGEFRVNTYTAGYQSGASVASDPVGNFAIVWGSRNDGDGSGVFGQRYGGLAPATLTLDVAGNRVLEAGETVEVDPAWRNFNGADQTFGGLMSEFIGPAGATYTLADSSGDYGTVTNGAVAACTDCFAVSVSNPPVRPAVHWDASIVETIVPDTHGQQKQWLLHVGGSFADVPVASPYYRDIETLLHRGISAGCGYSSVNSYCPRAAIRRDEMAPFLLVAREGEGYAPPPCGGSPLFRDVPVTNPLCPWIEELTRRGAVTQCSPDHYCPAGLVSREEIALFLLKTLEPGITPPPCAPPNVYADVPETSPYCPWIEELAIRGAAGGCGGGNYCPAAPVSREQMAAFLTSTFALTLYGR